ncbi:Uu.00g032140.m01.CDS01 [Anthostomella pinea]|uniref:Uu.00g032140.m01.CDS01 n=1 Tax=Anthostomella pinea TaxID=933095 RepID=A0AAI8V8M4_9PEZI|nr:Uu.00g032140.m01.CDS01 [Anthostomella pinea]
MTPNPFSAVTACLNNCFPRKEPQPAYPEFKSIRYNTQIRANLGLGERPLHLPARVEAGSASSDQPTIQRTSASPAGASNNNSPRPTTTTTAVLSGTRSPPRIKSQRRFPTTASGGDTGSQQPGWGKSMMTAAEMAELFDVLHRTFDHVPYAICGLGALIDHGFTGRRANKISILCPAHSKDNVKAWAQARGYATWADSVGLPMRDGTVRRVRIKYLVDDGFDRLERVRSSVSNATVLSMASQLDNVAAGWLDNRRRGDERALATIAKDVFWCLDHIVLTRTQSQLDPKCLPTFLGEAFWSGFTAKHPEARPEMARAGIDVSGVMKAQRERESLREHDAMLKMYGLQGDVVTEQPGLFEGMRDLAHSKSVYTLRDESVAGLETGPGKVGEAKKEKPLPRLPGEGVGRSLTTQRGSKPVKLTGEWI